MRRVGVEKGQKRQKGRKEEVKGRTFSAKQTQPGQAASTSGKAVVSPERQRANSRIHSRQTRSAEVKSANWVVNRVSTPRAAPFRMPASRAHVSRMLNDARSASQAKD